MAQVCNDHSLAISKKKPTISDFNNALKEAEVIDVSQWRPTQPYMDTADAWVRVFPKKPKIAIYAYRDGEPSRMLLLVGFALPVGVISAFVAKALLWLIGVITNLVFFQRFSPEMETLTHHHLGSWVIAALSSTRGY